MRLHLPKLYPILDVETLERRGVGIEEFMGALLDAGVEMVQLRDKRGSPRQVLAAAEIMTRAAAGTACRLVMNDRADLALLAGWSAVHVGHLDMPPEAVRRVFGAEGEVLVGVSTHNDRQVVEADAGSADYIAVGPVFATGTKADAEPVIGLEGVRRARKLTAKPLVAIGGITRGNAADVVEAGADSVAVIGGLLGEGESVTTVIGDFLRRLG